MPPPDGRRSPTRASLGTASLSISSLLVFSSGAKPDVPGDIASRPRQTGNQTCTHGVRRVRHHDGDGSGRFLRRQRCGPAVTTIRSTLRRTKSAASSGRRSFFCSANRYSMVIFFPSIHPSLLSSCRNASKRTAIPEAVLPSRKPMRTTFPCLLRVGRRAQSKSRSDRAKRMIFLVIGVGTCFLFCLRPSDF